MEVFSLTSRGEMCQGRCVKVVPAYTRRSGGFVDTRSSIMWYNVVRSLGVDSSDAPYSVVAPSWTTDGISRGFWREFRGYPFREAHSRN